MKLHEIRSNSTIYVAKLAAGVKMTDDIDLKRLKFKKYITKETKSYFAEWCTPITFKTFNGFIDLSKFEKNQGVFTDILIVSENIECYYNSITKNYSHNLVFELNSKDEIFIAIVDSSDMDYYVNVHQGE